MFFHERKPQTKQNIHFVFDISYVQYPLNIMAVLRPFSYFQFSNYIHINSQHIGQWLPVHVEHKIGPGKLADQYDLISFIPR